MRKYYYFVFNHGVGVAYTDNGCFPLYDLTMKLVEQCGDKNLFISFWHEISCANTKS